MKCPGCNAMIPNAMRHCPRCGRLLSNRRAGAVGETTRKDTREKTKVIFSARHGAVRLKKDVSDFKRAGFFIRAFAFAFDLFFVAMLAGAIISGGALFLGKTTGVFEGLLKSDGATFLNGIMPYAKAAIITAVVTPPFYFIVMHAIFGQTVGKMIMGIQVVCYDGSPIGFVRSVARFFGYFISGGLLFAGFFWIIIDVEKQGWHDMIADTIVIKI